MTALQVPALSLVALVGVSGAGKSTFAARHFLPTQVLSSDTFRGLVADDENDQSASADAFAALHAVAAVRLRRGLLTVLDATHLQRDDRAQVVALARASDVLPVALVLDVPEGVAARRTAERPDRDLPRHVLRRQHDQLRRSLRSLRKEGFRVVHVLRGAEEVDAAEITYERAWNDRTELTGPFDVVGDVHGCRAELQTLLARLGYAVRHDDEGRAVGAHHPEGRTAVLLGDLVDRGPDTPGVLRLVMGMVADGDALAVPGNHENTLVRALRGQQVRTSHGLAESLAQLAADTPEFRQQVAEFCYSLVSHLLLDGGRLVVAHAGLKEAYQGRASRRVRDFCLYGETTGETDEYGLPVRYPWAQEYRGAATVLYGHTPVPTPEWVNNTLCLDTGCVFGGRLTALRWPERELVSVPAERVHYEPVRPLVPADDVTLDGADVGAEGTAARREPDLLDVDGVLGRRVVETRLAGRVSVREENAAGALEVMSRFALDPRWLLHLPATTPPCGTSTRDGLLEHPEDAFAEYARLGVDRVVLEEKHMGSRALALVCADADVARARFGAADGATGAVWTRTGRSFFRPALREELLAGLRAALIAAGVLEELGTPWVLLDGELLPWSAKADGLLREQFAPVGAAGLSALPATAAVLDAAAARGLDVTELRGRTARRAEDVEAFRAAYRRYVWPTDGLSGVRYAPFSVLAGEGASFADRDRTWHLGLAEGLVAAAPELVAPTARLLVDTSDPDSCAAGVRWWEELCAAGGEGVVVKPVAVPLAPEPDDDGRPRPTRVPAALKCRGPEYLRIVYGPEYPRHLDRLRRRNLRHKRSMALREHALGVESLERAARGEPLWRVHEAVFAVLALESEPVDPRL